MILWAWSALIICMSHCSTSRGSTATAGEFPEETSPLTFFLASSLYPEAPGPQGAARPAGVPSDTATVRLAPMDSRALPAKRVTSARKAARSAWATTTPISGQDWTTTPCALVTDFSTSRVWPGLAFLALTM